MSLLVPVQPESPRESYTSTEIRYLFQKVKKEAEEIFIRAIRKFFSSNATVLGLTLDGYSLGRTAHELKQIPPGATLIWEGKEYTLDNLYILIIEWIERYNTVTAQRRRKLTLSSSIPKRYSYCDAFQLFKTALRTMKEKFNDLISTFLPEDEVGKALMTGYSLISLAYEMEGMSPIASYRVEEGEFNIPILYYTLEQWVKNNRKLVTD